MPPIQNAVVEIYDLIDSQNVQPNKVERESLATMKVATRAGAPEPQRLRSARTCPIVGAAEAGGTGRRPRRARSVQIHCTQCVDHRDFRISGISVGFR